MTAEYYDRHRPDDNQMGKPDRRNNRDADDEQP